MDSIDSGVVGFIIVAFIISVIFEDAGYMVACGLIFVADAIYSLRKGKVE